MCSSTKTAYPLPEASINNIKPLKRFPRVFFVRIRQKKTRGLNDPRVISYSVRINLPRLCGNGTVGRLP
jgi:hypothetical protein